MTNLSKKYIFTCKLKGVPVEFDAALLYHKEILKLLTLTGVWAKDPVFTSKLTKSYVFIILYPIRIFDCDGEWATYISPGDHHTVCL